MSQTYGHTYSSVEPRTRVLLDDGMMREILADVGGMRTAVELELWASWMLGQVWRQRARQPQFWELDWMLTTGAPLVAMIAQIGGARARKALSAISMLERGALGNYAGAIALTLPGARMPAWMADIAGARFGAARIGRSHDGDQAVLLDLYRGDSHEQTVAVFIDHQRDGAAKWIQLLVPVPADTGAGTIWDRLEPAPLGEVCAGVRAAIEATDRDPRAPALAEFADLRAFTLARVLDACEPA